MTAAEPSTSDRHTPDRQWAAALWSCLWLTLALAALFPALAALGFSMWGVPGVGAAALAAVVCWVGSFAALITTAAFRAPEQALLGVLGAMFFRMGLPLGAALLITLQGGALVASGALHLLIINYLLALLLETVLSLRLVRASTKGSKAA